ncbi:asparagine synthetase domain-containing protein 1 [Polyplosphaeria fusca]|uniref:Asparagine synthetase domain-containing protein 1 n=1 Tax=Polyplosphaeria fusca TaxID=682080 RepID=A0A9P4V3V6_9PLEO|nr:asparagine synthetase domain-containing protein 1 [Polyplosphaeria fusca]
MCGIFLSVCRNGYREPDSNTARLLQNRGPDSTGFRRIFHPSALSLHLTFLSTVLSLRGDSVVHQPLDHAGASSVLCWNGEAWKIGDSIVTGNDSSRVSKTLTQSCRRNPEDDRTSSIERVVTAISSIRGPFAFVFYDAENQYLYFGRDCLGRRSLLRQTQPSDDLILSSVCDSGAESQWTEVEADGIYVLDIQTSLTQSSLELIHIPQRRRDAVAHTRLYVELPFPMMNRTHPVDVSHSDSNHVVQLAARLRASLQLRAQHVRESIKTASSDAEVAILFSGGLDCTVLARLTHELLPPAASIDLLNVAFENPRIHGKLGPYESPYELCPDRITGRISYAELLRECPDRNWRFLEVNVPFMETTAHRPHVLALMHPHNTEMDLSISLALYFASRGVGRVKGLAESYTTSAHVLLSGLGADELFGGYQRHAIAFARQGYEGLMDELELDFDRLGKRNLGRDDRIISDSGKEVRFPYLDEELIAFALQLPVSAKCDFGSPQLPESNEPSQFLEPGKRILRLLAWSLGMTGVAAEKKRAIQFGARTAKMETGKTKGTQVLT